jgi:hypothetical protein
MDAPIRPIASNSLEAGAIAMAPVPQHLLDSMDDLYEEYFSVREECPKLNASNALNPIWETKVEILQQTLKNLNEIRAAAMKIDRELQTAINNDLPDGKRLTRLDRQAEACQRKEPRVGPLVFLECRTHVSGGEPARQTRFTSTLLCQAGVNLASFGD